MNYYDITIDIERLKEQETKQSQNLEGTEDRKDQQQQERQFLQDLKNAVKTCVTSFKLYKKIAEFIIQKAKDNDPHFDRELGNLELGTDQENKSLAFKLSDNAVTNYEDEIKKEKIVALNNYFTFLLDNHHEISAIFGTDASKLYKPIDSSITSSGQNSGSKQDYMEVVEGSELKISKLQLSDFLRKIRRDIFHRAIPKNYDPLIDINAITNQEPGLITTIRNLRKNARGTKTKTIRKETPGKLHNFLSQIPDFVVEEFFKLVVAELDRFREGKKAKQNRLNEIMAVLNPKHDKQDFSIGNILAELRSLTKEKIGKLDQNFWQKILPAITTKSREGTGRTSSKSITTLVNIEKKLIAFIKAKIGFTDLEIVKNKAFSREDKTRQLVRELRDMCHEIFGKLTLQIATDKEHSHSEQLSLMSFRPYTFYDYQEYVVEMKKKNLPDQNSNDANANIYKSPYDSLYIPLLQPTDAALKFYNCEGNLYCEETTSESTAWFFDNRTDSSNTNPESLLLRPDESKDAKATTPKENQNALDPEINSTSRQVDTGTASGVPVQALQATQNSTPNNLSTQAPLKEENSTSKTKDLLRKKINKNINTKWQSISNTKNLFKPARTYFPLYLYQPPGSSTSNDSLKTYLMWRKPSGFGGSLGIGRADGIRSGDYLWAFIGDIKALNKRFSTNQMNQNSEITALTPEILGSFLGLDPNRRLYQDENRHWKLKNSALTVNISVVPLKTPSILDNSLLSKTDTQPQQPKAQIPTISNNNNQPLSAAPSGSNADVDEFGYEFIELNPPESEEENQQDQGLKTDRYVLCNTPYPPGFRKTPLDTIHSHPHSHFYIKYYRRVDFGLNEHSKVVKDLNSQSRYKPDKTDVPEGLQEIVENKSKDLKIGINLPISFHLSTNYFKLADTKSKLGVIKNKGNALYKNLRFRNDAGKVMASIYVNIKKSARNDLPPGAKNTLSATQFANVIVAQQKAQNYWQKLKRSHFHRLPTQQEWCHLLGHGDDGRERVGNFVSGSTHCNTEQLAIEEAQRLTTHKSGKGNYILKSTAYLLGDDSMQVTPDQNSFLDQDRGYLENAYNSNPAFEKGKTDPPDSILTQNTSSPMEIVTNSITPPSNTPQEKNEKQNIKTQNSLESVKTEESKETINRDLSLTRTNAPVAAFIRYKIYKKVENRYQKLFDYVFEAQSEFIDKNQYRILNATVRHILAPSGFFSEIHKYWNELGEDEKKPLLGDLVEEIPLQPESRPQRFQSPNPIEQFPGLKEKVILINLNVTQIKGHDQNTTGNPIELQSGTVAIVNASNSDVSLKSSDLAGLSRAIHDHANKNQKNDSLRDECVKILALEKDKAEKGQGDVLKIGEAILTDSLNFKNESKVDSIIHTAGPNWSLGIPIEPQKSSDLKALGNCYYNSLIEAQKKQISNIVFPSISTDLFKVPPNLAVPAQLEGIQRFFQDNPNVKINVYLNYYNMDLKKSEILEKLYESALTINQEKSVRENFASPARGLGNLERYPHPLPNISGGSCYLNASLQFLISVREIIDFSNTPRKKREAEETEADHQKLDKIRLALVPVFATMHKANAAKSEIEEKLNHLNNSVKAYRSDLQDNSQHKDPSEYLKVLLDSVGYSRSSASFIYSADQNDDLISAKTETQTLIFLPITSSTSLKECIQEYNKREILTGENQYQFNNRKIDASKRLGLVEATDSLIVALNRWKINGQADYKSISLHDQISFPIFDQETGQEKDHITMVVDAVIVQAFGSEAAGHFVTYRRIRNDPDHWLVYNDSIRKVVSKEEALVEISTRGYVISLKKEKLGMVDSMEIVQGKDNGFGSHPPNSSKIAEIQKIKEGEFGALKDKIQLISENVTSIGKQNISVLENITGTIAIVNAANFGLQGGGGIDGAIHTHAGEGLIKANKNAKDLKEKVEKNWQWGMGEALAVPTTNLTNFPQKNVSFIIQTFGPDWQSGRPDLPQKVSDLQALSNCYTNSLKEAAAKKVDHIVFPSISTAIFAVPLDLAIPAHLKGIKAYFDSIQDTNIQVYINCYLPKEEKKKNGDYLLFAYQRALGMAKQTETSPIIAKGNESKEASPPTKTKVTSSDLKIPESILKNFENILKIVEKEFFDLKIIQQTGEITGLLKDTEKKDRELFDIKERNIQRLLDEAYENSIIDGDKYSEIKDVLRKLKELAWPIGAPTKELKKKTAEETAKRSLKLGEAIDNGDCLFDSLAQGLNAVGLRTKEKKQYDISAVKDVVIQYLSNLPEQNQSTDNKATTTEASVRKYPGSLFGTLNGIPKTLKEWKERLPKSATETFIWGHHTIEGRIIAKQLKVNLRYISASFEEEENPQSKVFFEDKLLYYWVGEKFDENKSKTYSPTEELDKPTLIIAQYPGHYMPVFSVKSEQKAAADPTGRKEDSNSFQDPRQEREPLVKKIKLEDSSLPKSQENRDFRSPPSPPKGPTKKFKPEEAQDQILLNSDDSSENLNKSQSSDDENDPITLQEQMDLDNSFPDDEQEYEGQFKILK